MGKLHDSFREILQSNCIELLFKFELNITQLNFCIIKYIIYHKYSKYFETNLKKPHKKYTA